MHNAIEFARSHADAFVADLSECLRIPSIGTRPEHAADTAACADWIVTHLHAMGIDGAVAEPTPGHPMITGAHIVDPSLPTVLLYGHYDVQPPEPLELWQSPPFEPDVRDGVIYARGAVDDKGQLFMIIKALESFLRSKDELPVNVKFAVEGEEESGSESLRPFLESHRDALAADTVLICDTTMIDPQTPAITRSLRGMAYAQVDLRAASRDMHSGAFGGSVVNVLHVVGELVASLHDEQNRVTVPGFYEGANDPSDEERREVAAQPFDEAIWRESAGGSPPRTETGYTIAEATALRPCLDVNGVWGGYAGSGAKTVIPGEAGLKVSARLVGDQKPEEVYAKIASFVRSRVPDGVDVSVTPLGFGSPLTVAADTPAVLAASRALEETFDRAPVMYRGGGSIPAAALFGEILGLDATMMGFGLKTDNVHAPNEHFGLDRFANGIESVIRFLHHFGAMR